MHTLLYNCFSHSTFRHSFIIIFFLEFLKMQSSLLEPFFSHFFIKVYGLLCGQFILRVWYLLYGSLFSIFEPWVNYWTQGVWWNILWAPLWLAAAFLSIRGCIKCCYVNVSKYWECTVLVWWKFYVGNLFLYSHLN